MVVATSPSFAGVPEVVVQYGTRPAVSFVEVLTVPVPPDAVDAMTIVLLFVVVERVMLEPAARELKRRTPEDSESKILRPVPREEPPVMSPAPADENV